MTVFEELRSVILEKVRKGVDPLDGFFAPKDVKEAILAVLVAGRHLLLESPPGTGKTTVAKIIAKLLPSKQFVKGCRFNCDPENPDCFGCKGSKKLEPITLTGDKRFVRVQGSPELMPEDLVGEIDLVAAMKYGVNDPNAFTPGKIQKANRKILFIDELNRVPERTQSTLLQVLEEGATTIAGFDIEVNVDTLVIATANPEESAGAVRLSETLKDRLEIVKVGYPTKEQEMEIIRQYGKTIEGVSTSKEIIEKIVDVSRNARSYEGLENQLSIRATLSIFENSQALTKLRGGTDIQIDDVKKAARISLNGRLGTVEWRYEELDSLISNIIDGAIQS